MTDSQQDSPLPPVATFVGGPLDGGLLSRPSGVALPPAFDAGGGARYTLVGEFYYLDGEPRVEPEPNTSEVIPEAPLPAYGDETS